MSIDLSTARSPNKWEDLFVSWSRPPEKAEQERCDNAVKQVSKAIAAHAGLNNKTVETFPQGSYANRVNVRRDSDVDICCLHTGVFFYTIPSDYDKSYFGLNTPAEYKYSDYKNEIEKALVARFGRQEVVRGNKAFDINENTMRVDADVVATFAYRKYYMNADSFSFNEGTALLTDKGNLIATNFPQQQYDRGVEKNNVTRRRYKAQVRIQKAIRNQMLAAGVEAASPIASFLIESLCWCAPNGCYGYPTLFGDFEAVVMWAYGQTETEQGSGLLREANGIKSLFGSHNLWTRGDVRNYLDAAWELTH